MTKQTGTQQIAEIKRRLAEAEETRSASDLIYAMYLNKISREAQTSHVRELFSTTIQPQIKSIYAPLDLAVDQVGLNYGYIEGSSKTGVSFSLSLIPPTQGWQNFLGQ
jgi:hypothetical protein